MAILFGVLSIVVGLVAPILFGIWGFFVTAIFAILAGVFAIKAKKAGGSATGGIVTAVVGVVLGLAGMALMVAMAGVLADEAKKQNLPIIADHADKLKFGVVGFVTSVTSDDIDMDALSAELKKFNESSSTTETTTTAE